MLDGLRLGESFASISRLFNVNESTVRSIKKSVDKIRSSVASTSLSAKIVRDPATEKMEVASPQPKKGAPEWSNGPGEASFCMISTLFADLGASPGLIGLHYDSLWLRIWTLNVFDMASTSRILDPQPGPSQPRALTSDSHAHEDIFMEDKPYVDRDLNVDEILAMWSLAKIVRQLGTRDQCVAFAEAQGLMPTQKLCRTHRTHMGIAASNNGSFGLSVCQKRTCKGKNKEARTNGTLFENIKIDVEHVFYLIYAFAHKMDYNAVRREDPFKKERQKCLSRDTVCDWYSYCQEAVVIYQLEKIEAKDHIGDQARSYSRTSRSLEKENTTEFFRRHIEGHCVLGITEDGSEDLRLEVCPFVQCH
ncbi:hypothetical protein evm_003139 [Chilo suppressalis]|nr:hypothetical protein evm_003139 [Chilo suppressalis]